MRAAALILILCNTAIATLPDNFKPQRLSRQEWDAQNVRAAKLSMDTKKKALFIIGHHGISSFYSGSDGDKEVARSIQRHQMRDPEWGDIGYHFLVGRTGTILEGRQLEAAPSCYVGSNSGSVCGTFLGCFDDSCNPPNEVTDEMLHAMGLAIADSAYKLGITDLGRHNIKGFSELGNKFPHSPGSRIMRKDSNGVAPIDVVVLVAKQALATMMREL